MPQVAIITGSSRGIGAAIAENLASQGINVVINCRSSLAQGEAVAEKCRAYGVEAIALAWDVADYAACEENVKTVIEKMGDITILVNNAGITQDGLLVRMTEQQFDAVIDNNLKSAFYMTKICGSYMMKKRYGRIVNISSVAGVYGNAGQANYAAAKAGLIGFTKSVAKELGSRNITVNAVAPGFVETDMTKDLPEQLKETAKGNIALKRFAKPEEIASVVGFLCSPQASYITAQAILVDGGMAL